MDESSNASLQGDLSWTRRPVGLFTPINWNPDDTPDASTRSALLPEHNRPEDLRMTRFGTSPTPLETLAAQRGEILWSTDKAYLQVPQNLLEIPRRLLQGVPLIERHNKHGTTDWAPDRTKLSAKSARYWLNKSCHHLRQIQRSSHHLGPTVTRSRGLARSTKVNTMVPIELQSTSHANFSQKSCHDPGPDRAFHCFGGRARNTVYLSDEEKN